MVPTGLIIPAKKRGFCRRNAASKVESARGKPAMTCMRRGTVAGRSSDSSPAGQQTEPHGRGEQAAGGRFRGSNVARPHVVDRHVTVAGSDAREQCRVGELRGQVGSAAATAITEGAAGATAA